MPQVPTYGNNAPQVAETRAPAVTATPAEFGARQGAQQQQLGAALQETAATGVNILARMQEQENLEMVFAAETSLRQAETEFHSQLRERKGTAAKGASQDAMKFWDEKHQELTGTLGNDPQRQAFEKIYQQRRNASLGQVAQHEVVERRAAATEAAKASITSTIENGIANPGAADENVDAIRRTYESLGKMNGTDPDVVKLQVRTAATKMHAGVVDSLVDTHPGAARAYYNEYKSEILPSARDRIEDSLRVGETKGFAQRHADQIMAKYDDPGKQLEAARNATSDPDRRSALVAEVRAQQGDRARVEATRQDDAYQQSLDLVTDRQNPVTSVNGIPSSTWREMSGAQKRTITDYLDAKAGGPRKVDDYTVLDQAQAGIESGDITEPDQLLLFEPFLRPETFRGLRTQLEKSKQVSATDVLKVFENRVGKSRAKWLDDDTKQAQWKAFQDYVYSNVKEGTYSPTQLRDMADTFFLDAYKPGTGFLGAFRESMTYGEAVQAGRGDEFLIEAPEDTREGMRRSLKILDRYGASVVQGDTAEDEFYTNWQLPATNYLERHQMAVTPENVSALIMLTAKKKAVSPQAIRQIAAQIQGTP